MQENNLEESLYQILSGIHYLKYSGQEYSCVPNTLLEKRRASLLYQDIMDNLGFEDYMITWEEAQLLTNRLGYWTPKDEISLKGFEKMIENLKVEIYQSYMRDDICDSLRKQIKKISDSIQKSMLNKFKLYDTTKEYYAENIKRQYLIAMSIRDENNNRVFQHQNFSINHNSNLITCMLNYIDSKRLMPNIVRKIARTEPWRSMWAIAKPNIFEKPIIEWTDEQRFLCSYSKMYDNVYESLECPPDKVIEDDDMLDGWFIVQRRERENKQKENNIDKITGKKHRNGGQQEVFLVANNPQEASNIYNMNDDISRNIIRSREQVIKKSQEEIDHQYLPDVQNELRIQATKQFQNTMRKK